MAESKRMGGLYRGASGFHDAEGHPIDLAEVAEIDKELLTKDELKELKAESKKKGADE